MSLIEKKCETCGHGKKADSGHVFCYDALGVECAWETGRYFHWIPKSLEDIHIHGGNVTPDPVNHPAHYCPDGMKETKYRMREFLGDDKYRAFCECCILKYLDRYQRKGTPILDLGKIIGYAKILIELEEEIHNG